MFFYDWFKSILGFFGLWNKKFKLVFLGLDNAGKTTLLHRLKTDAIAQHSPTSMPTSAELSIGGIKLMTYDLGGHRQARTVWKDYYPAVDGIVFLVDSSDRERFPEVKSELYRLLADELVENIPISFIVNKIDLPNAVSEEEIKNVFDLYPILSGKDPKSKDDNLQRRPFELFMCSVLRRQGYGTALRWLAQRIS